MSNYIKIRELNPYPTPTGVFSGDMIACSLDTTTAGTPHSTQNTQKATVKQVFESYNTQVAREQAKAAEDAGGSGPSAQPGVIKDSNGDIIDGGPALTPSTFNNYIKVGGGLEFAEKCVTQPDGTEKCTYELGVATSAASTQFTLVCSGNSLDTEYKVTSNGWVSGRFPTLKSAVDWVNVNIQSAKTVRFLIATDLTEENVRGAHYNMSNQTIESVLFEDYGYYAVMYDQNTNVAGNGSAKWSETYAASAGYKQNNIVQYTGKNDGTIGDYNLYRAKGNGASALPTDSTHWEPFVPSLATGLSSVDPNGFSSEGFTSRPTINFNQARTAPNTNPIPWWMSHGGQTFFIGLKLAWHHLNDTTDSSPAHWNFFTIWRRESEIMQWAGCEIHLNGRGIRTICQGIRGATVRVTADISEALFSIPDPYHVTGAAGSYAPIPALYLSCTGLVGAQAAGTGVGSVFELESSSEALMGLEYWGHGTRNGGHEGSRIQFGSGLNHVTAMVECSESSRVGGGVGIQCSPTTTFAPGGVNLVITGYGNGLGRNGEHTYPSIAPIAARQFISNNTQNGWISGNQATAGSTSVSPLRWPGTVASIASGDDFTSSKYAGAPAGTINGDLLGRFIRYPD